MITSLKLLDFSLDLDPQSALYQLVACKSIRLELREGATIFHPDQRQDSLYFVQKGVLRSYVEHNDTDITRWFYTTGDLAYSALSFYHGLPSDVCLEAACPSVVLQIYREDYEELCNDHPDFRHFVNRLQASYLYKAAQYNDAFKTLSRLERYEKFMADFQDVNMQVKVRHIASFLGMTPDTLSKIRKQFMKEPPKNSPKGPSNRG